MRDYLVQESYSEYFDDYRASAFFKHPSTGQYIAIGTRFGAEDNVTYALYRRGWRGTNFVFSGDAASSHKNWRPHDNTALLDGIDPDMAVRRAITAPKPDRPSILILEDGSAASLAVAKALLDKSDFDLVLQKRQENETRLSATAPGFAELASVSAGYHYFVPEAHATFAAERFAALEAEPHWTPAFTHPDNMVQRYEVLESHIQRLKEARAISTPSPGLAVDALLHDKRTIGHDLTDILDDFAITHTVIDDFVSGIAQRYQDPDTRHTVFDQLFFRYVWPAQEEAAQEQPDNEPNRLYAQDELAGENCCLGRSRLIRAVLAKLAPGEEEGFLTLYRQYYQNYIPLLVVQAERALLRNARAEAADLLTRCLGLFYDDIYVQKLFLHATRQKILTLHLAGSYCGKPFQAFEVFQGGDVHLCCKPWQPVTVGNVFRQGYEDIWNSRKAKLVRKSIIDGSYRYCSPISCPLMKKLPDYQSADPAVKYAIDTGTLSTDKAPYRLALSYDRSCNLSCPQCRTTMITAKGEWRQELERIERETILPLLKKVGFAYITGSGDAFGSRHFNSILHKLNRQNYPNLTLHLMTNGQLLTEKLWQNLSNLHDIPGYLTVSIDGATKDTYEELRRGGKFSVICQNMEMIGEVRRQGTIDRLEVNMVVQKSNFREMKLLIEMCRRWHVDAVLFYRLKQWGTYTAEDFKERDVFNPDHPEHNALLEELEDPVFESDIVNPWDLSPLLVKVGRNRQDQKAEPFLR